MITKIENFIDSTYLKTKKQSGLTEEEEKKFIKSFVLDAIEYRFKLVMVRSEHITFAKK